MKDEPCLGLHAVVQSLGMTRCAYCGWAWIGNEWVRLAVCPHEDCPYPVRPGDEDCGNHESWMT